MDISKETEGIKKEGATEIKVDTVDYRSPAGEDREAKKENVEVTHVKNDKPAGDKGVMAQTATKVAETIKSAKEAVSGTHDHSTHTDKSE